MLKKKSKQNNLKAYDEKSGNRWYLNFYNNCQPEDVYPLTPESLEWDQIAKINFIHVSVCIKEAAH